MGMIPDKSQGEWGRCISCGKMKAKPGGHDGGLSKCPRVDLQRRNDFGKAFDTAVREIHAKHGEKPL